MGIAAALPNNATHVQRRRPGAVASPRVMTATPETHEASWWIGRTIANRHRIVRHIATGGMGHVFLAQHVRLGGYVAVKVLVEGSDQQALQYFGNEARVLSYLKHPNIVGIVDCGVLREGGCYIVMEWLAGQDLASFIAQNGRLSPKRALWVLTQLASAIDYMHGRGLVHRDIKPDNVIFHPDAYDAVKLFDFGVAIPFQKPPAAEQSKVIGTPLYMAPEQAAGQASSPSTDLYALGALALELLTGEAPYERVSAAEVVAAVLTQPPALPSQHGVHLPGLDEVIAKALARNPADRFSSALDFVVALREVIEGQQAPALSLEPAPLDLARPTKPVRPSLRPTIVWAEHNDTAMPTTKLARSRKPAAVSGLAKFAAACFGLAAWLISI